MWLGEHTQKPQSVLENEVLTQNEVLDVSRCFGGECRSFLLLLFFFVDSIPLSDPACTLDPVTENINLAIYLILLPHPPKTASIPPSQEPLVISKTRCVFKTFFIIRIYFFQAYCKYISM